MADSVAIKMLLFSGFISFAAFPAKYPASYIDFKMSKYPAKNSCKFVENAGN